MKHTFTAKSCGLLSELISQNVSGLPRSAIKILLNQGEVKLNGLKQKTDCLIKTGDIAAVFIPQKFITPLTVEIVYSDQNILIANKPRLMDTENNLTAAVQRDFPSARPMHRLDRNTEGLVAFALNQTAYDILFSAFKNKKAEKFYYAVVNGKFTADGEHTAYLKKVPDKSYVLISGEAREGYKKIVSQFRFIKSIEGEGDLQASLIEAKPVTGRTHQLRAHLNFLGHPIVGDSKYGDGAGYQKLAAYKLVFKELPPPLHYLNNKEFSTILISLANLID